MRQFVLGILAFFLVNGVLGEVVLAQEPIVTDTPTSPSGQVGYVPAPQTYDELRRDELVESTRRSRNALIGTSAATAVGAALLFPGLVRHCERAYPYTTYDSELQCDRAGSALVGVGMPLFVGGLIGAVTTGIMFGVRKGRLNRLQDKMAYGNPRVIRWDPASSRFVF